MKSFFTRPWARILCLISIAALILTSTSTCSAEAKIPLSVGIVDSPSSTLIITARELGYFTDEGLTVTLTIFPSGLEAMRSMAAGDIDIAMSSDFVAAGEVLKGNDVQIFTSIDRINHNYLYALKDRNIKVPIDLSGKKIGLPRGTAAEFYLARFLFYHNCPADEVTLVDIEPGQAAAYLESGTLDAVVAWQPDALQVEETLGDTVIKWAVQSNQTMHSIAAAPGEKIQEFPDVVKKFLMALQRAETYCMNSPEETKEIVADFLELPAGSMETFWPEHIFSLTLEQSLLLAMEDQARWMIENGMTTSRKMPDLSKHFYYEALKAIKPEAVNLLIGGSQ